MKHQCLSMNDLFPLALQVYQRTGTGCCLHVTLEDLNVEDDNIRSCLEQARREGHRDCESLALIMLRLTEKQRYRLGKRVVHEDHVEWLLGAFPPGHPRRAHLGGRA